MSPRPVTILTFYHFHSLDALEALREDCLARMKASGVRGTLLLAPEGMNATIAGDDGAVHALLTHLRAMPGFETMTHRESRTDKQPFGRAMVKIRDELISLGQPVEPAKRAGRHVPPQAWNDLIGAEDVLLIDGRNGYEAKIGTFAGALDLGARDFKGFPELLAPHLAGKKRIAMFCTGGIRCEKLSSHCLDQGVEEVYQLEGGILHYLEQVPEAESRWRGECYVFDERVAVGHGLRPRAPVSFCPGCGHPLNETDWAHPHFYPGIRCGYCATHVPTN